MFIKMDECVLGDAASGVCRAIPVRQQLYACLEGRNAIVSHHEQLFNMGVSEK